MGNENCAQIQELSQQSQAYGDFKILKEGAKHIALIEKTVEYSPELRLQIEKKLKVRLHKLKSPHIAKLLRYKIGEGNLTTSVTMYYDFIPNTLTDRRKQLSQQKDDQFTERELFNIIYGVESALQELEDHEIRHGCINLETILCQGNFYKITDVSSTTFVKSYDLVRRGCRKQFLSEKLLTSLEYKSLEPFYDIEDDLFSLGVIILCLVSGSQSDARDFYVWKTKANSAELNWKAIESAMETLKRNYSSKLVNKVKHLVRLEKQQEQSLETNFTSLNNLNSEVTELDREIDRVLSIAALNGSIGKE